MNVDQVKSLARSALQVAGPLMVARGWIATDDLNPDIDIVISFVGAAFTLFGLVWGQIANMKANKIAAVAAIPEVQAIVTTSQKQADAGGPKVVTPADAGTTGIY